LVQHIAVNHCTASSPMSSNPKHCAILKNWHFKEILCAEFMICQSEFKSLMSRIQILKALISNNKLCM
jgi:hypothetical protein